jgi:hypothetical protein
MTKKAAARTQQIDEALEYRVAMVEVLKGIRVVAQNVFGDERVSPQIVHDLLSLAMERVEIDDNGRIDLPQLEKDLRNAKVSAALVHGDLAAADPAVVLLAYEATVEIVED